MSHLIQKEVLALLPDARGRIPVALMDDSVMDKAAPIRDRIGVGHALAYLESKGMDMEGAMDRLDTARH